LEIAGEDSFPLLHFAEAGRANTNHNTPAKKSSTDRDAHQADRRQRDYAFTANIAASLCHLRVPPFLQRCDLGSLALKRLLRASPSQINLKRLRMAISHAQFAT